MQVRDKELGLHNESVIINELSRVTKLVQFQYQGCSSKVLLMTTYSKLHIIFDRMQSLYGWHTNESLLKLSAFDHTQDVRESLKVRKFSYDNSI